jgi:hypothetical protein
VAAAGVRRAVSVDAASWDTQPSPFGKGINQTIKQPQSTTKQKQSVKYEQTIGDVRRAAAAKLGIADAADLQLFRHKRELVPERDDAKTLLEMDIHTGFGLRGYDLSSGAPDYFPPVKSTPDGLIVVD